MMILLILLFALVLFIIIFALKLINIVKKDDFNRTLLFFRRYLFVIFTGLALFYIVMIIICILTLPTYEYIYVLLVKYIIYSIYFSAIFMTSKKLLNNLSNNIIFEDANTEYIQEIGSYFIYLSVVEIIAGIVIGIINFLTADSWAEFRLQTNISILLFLVIGIILLIISYILKKAIEIYKENQLTI
ncbi:MAG: DUF2975 domain-containing protein [Bacilli bacterium]|nr:DUF2975 domain-containing protein [Bacilli bacterium]